MLLNLLSASLSLFTSGWYCTDQPVTSVITVSVPRAYSKLTWSTLSCTLKSLQLQIDIWQSFDVSYATGDNQMQRLAMYLKQHEGLKGNTAARLIQFSAKLWHIVTHSNLELQNPRITLGQTLNPKSKTLIISRDFLFLLSPSTVSNIASGKDKGPDGQAVGMQFWWQGQWHGDKALELDNGLWKHPQFLSCCFPLCLLLLLFLPNSWL